MVKELLQQRKFQLLLLSLALVIPFEVLSLLSIHFSVWVELPISLIFIVFFGRDIFKSALQGLLNSNFSNINLLVVIATIGAVYLGEYEEAIIIIILFALGNALEDFGIERSQNALKHLTDSVPKSVQLKGRGEKTPIENVQIGEIIIIKHGDYLPLDGEVIEGDAVIDESSITGEPLPKNKRLGDQVYAGTMSTQGYIEVKVTKLSKDTTLAKILDSTFQSLEKKSQSQKFIERFASFYTPVIVALALGMVIIPVFILKQPFNYWLMESLTLLLVACPCALVISTPISIFSAIGNASGKGLVIKGGKYLEEMGKVKVIAFDKTRTLTKGTPIVSNVIPFNNVGREDLLACIAGMEALSEHPLAKSIVEKAKEDKLSPHSFTDFQALMGKGATANCTVCVDKHHCIGNLKFISSEHEVQQQVLDLVEKLEAEGKTTIVVSDDKKVSGVIGVTDEIRPESKTVIEKLKTLGIKPVMLTGDNKSSANFIAKELGIIDVRAELLPEEKSNELNELIKTDKHVAMIGDGVNDAPALAAAPVGIAMGAMGSDVAIENADIALMNNDIQTLPYLVRIGRKTTQTIKTNVALAILVKLVFLGLAAVGKSNLALAIFADVGVTLVVVVNGLKLYSYNVDKV